MLGTRLAKSYFWLAIRVGLTSATFLDYESMLPLFNLHPGTTTIYEKASRRP